MEFKKEEFKELFKDIGKKAIKLAEIRDGRLHGACEEDSLTPQELSARIDVYLKCMEDLLQEDPIGENPLKIERVESSYYYVIKRAKTDETVPGFGYNLKEALTIFLEKILSIEAQDFVLIGRDRSPEDGGISSIEIRYLPTNVVLRRAHISDWKSKVIRLSNPDNKNYLVASCNSYSEVDARDIFLNILNKNLNGKFSVLSGIALSSFIEGLHCNGLPVSSFIYKRGEILFQCSMDYVLTDYNLRKTYLVSDNSNMGTEELLYREMEYLNSISPDLRIEIEEGDYRDPNWQDIINKSEKGKKSIELLKNTVDEAYEEDLKRYREK